MTQSARSARLAALAGTVTMIVAAFLLALPATAQGQGAAGKRPLTHDDYDSWKSIRSQRISTNGQWVAYQIMPAEGDGELVVRSTRTTTEYRHPRGQGALFTEDSSFLIFTVVPPEDSLKAAEGGGGGGARAGGPRGPGGRPGGARGGRSAGPKNQLAIMSLRDGSVTTIERVKNFRLPAEADGWVAYLMEEPEEEEPEEGERAQTEEEPAQEEGEQEEEEERKEKDYGTELIVRSLADGSQTSFASVLDYRFTENGRHLLYIVSSEDSPETDGIYAHQPGQAESQALITGEANYERWTFNEDETHLAFLTDRDDYDAEESTFNLYGWVVGESAAMLWVSHTSTSGFPAGFSVSNNSALSFTDDGGIVKFGIKEIPEPKPEEDAEDEEEEEEEKAEFELWSWNDPYPYPQQLQNENRYRNRTFDAVYHVGNRRFVQLGDEEMWSVQLSDDGRVGFGQTDLPYTQRISFDSGYYDFYVVDPATGNRTLIKKESYNRGSLSPNGKYVSWWGTDRQWHVYDIAAQTTADITHELPVPFWRRTDDRPQPLGSYGTAGWTDNDASLLVYDEFDIWEIGPDGTGARCITEGYGRANKLVFRYWRTDPDADTINPTGTLMLNVTNDVTKSTGVAQDRVAGTREPRVLNMAAVRYGFPAKAKDADVVLTTRSTFYEFPDLWVTDMRFRNFTKISDVGAQRDQFIWGKSELVNYIAADGNELRGILTKPENFDPNRKYPMLVYIYEKLTQGLHSFRNPGPGTSINLSYYVSNGYIIWQPDIWYGTGHPGQDALNCVEPSVKKIISLGFVDPERVGLQGHSWGGYQGAYMITQTDIFAAVESGAPVSNMTSAYGGIRWASGMVRQMQYEHTQSRLGRTLWDGGMMRYIENSPVFFADRINTPVLILHNDEDGAVPWYQGIEFIMALRRLEKPAWMFNYNGEAHGLRQRPNQKDFTVRMQEFFDHYLKGAPKPDWMKHGIQAWKKEK